MDILEYVTVSKADDLTQFARHEENAAHWEEETIKRFNAFGPKSQAYLSARRQLAYAYRDAGRWDQAIELCKRFEHEHPGELTQERAENLELLAELYLLKGSFLEATELIVPVVQATSRPIFGQWSTYYHVRFLLLLAWQAKERQSAMTDIEPILYHAFLTCSNQLGKQITLSYECRLLLALCQEEQDNWDYALSNEQVVYQWMKKRNLFARREQRVGLLCHIYRAQRALGKDENAVETRIWISHLLEGASAEEKRETEAYLQPRK